MPVTPSKKRNRCGKCGRFTKSFCTKCTMERVEARLPLPPMPRQLGWLPGAEMSADYGRIKMLLAIVLTIAMIAGLGCN